jgi:hypothetical protein
MHAVAEEEVSMSQGYEIDMLRSSVYTPQKGFGAPSVAGASKDRTKLIIRVSTQESLLPDDFQARKVELVGVAKRCELYFEGYFPSAGFTKNTRVEFMRSDADGIARVENLSDEEFLRRMTLAVYENGELIFDELESQAA